MKTKKRTTYIDVTQLTHWAGHLTGIPRVMNELAIRFRKYDSNIVFVSWVKEMKSYCEIDFDTTLALRGKSIAYERINRPNEANRSKSWPATSTLLLKQTVKKAARVGVAQTARVNPRLSSRIEQRARALHMKRFKQAEFEKGDTLVVLWGEWWDECFIKMLETKHKEQGIKIVQAIYDMGPIVVPQFSGSGGASTNFPIYCRRILPICSLVLSNSQFSKRTIVEWLQANKLHVPTVKVFRLGEDFQVAKATEPTDLVFTQSGLRGADFILCVGTFEIKKNHMLFYYVYKLAKLRGIKLPKLLIVGRRGWKTETIYDLITEDPEVKDDILFLQNVDDQGLSWLYDHCLFTIQASFYEGWGIPVAESIARGVPSICSNTSSMVEIAEGIVEHFSPASTDECLAAIRHLLKPANLEKARQRTKKYKQFSWDQSFRQVNKYLEEL